ncbi:MAG: hypothetical protein ABJB47_15515 [Actinomycetota bacterium]
MPNTSRSLRPLWTELRAARSRHRAERSARKALEAELSTYTSPSDLNDLDAILDRYADDDTRDIRRILATQRTA